MMSTPTRETIELMIRKLEDPNFQMSYTPWRHGGFYTNVRYPSGAVGCVISARCSLSGKFEIACDERPDRGEYKTRNEAAHAERALVVDMWRALL